MAINDPGPNSSSPEKTSWPVDFSILRAPPRWFATATTTVITFFVIALLLLAIIAVAQLAIDLLSGNHQRASDAIKALLPVAAALIGLPLIIWRLVILAEQTRISEAKTQIDRETYYTSIFAKSVELMGVVRESKSVGAAGNDITRSVPNIESRLGALYSLERLLTESIRDQRAIIETLCAYIRENSPLTVPEDEAGKKQFLRGDIPPRPTHRADVQAALTIIGRRPETIQLRAKREGWHLDLRNTNLVAYDFSNLNYDFARFDNSFLNEANMSGANLANCSLENTFMRSTKMRAAIFHSAKFYHCDVKGAEIEDTDFSRALLVGTDLRNAQVVSFNIKGANLENAFGDYVDYSLKTLKECGPDIVNSREVVGIYQLFKKATYDDATNISEAVREAIIIMMQSVVPQTTGLAQLG